MATEWLSESTSEGAKSAIILGSVDSLKLSDLSKEFPKGILWFSTPRESDISLPKVITLIDRKESSSRVKEKLEEFMLLDYDSAPSVLVSKSINEESKLEYNKILDLTISEIEFLFIVLTQNL